MDEKFCSQNPITKEQLWEGFASGEKEIEEAVLAAKQAFPIWSAYPFEKRAEYLYAFKKALQEEKQSFAEIISKETGKPLWESITEVDSMIGKVDISIVAFEERCPKKSSSLGKNMSMTRHKPHGVVCVLGPYNFPGHLPNGHIVPALLAGNTVVFKPSELTPLVGEKMFAFWQKVGMPKGAVNLVQGGAKTGQLLAAHPSFNALFFTGSWQTGRALSEEFGKTPQKMLALEMGGNNPLVIADIANIPAAVLATIQSAYLTAGQRCTCARRLIVIENNTSEEYLFQLIAGIQSIRLGAYTERPEPFMGPVINEKAALDLLSAQNALIAKGGIPLVKMSLITGNTTLLSPGLIDVTAIKELPDEEYFGPLLQLIRVPDFAAAVHESNRTTYGLAASILTEKKEQYEDFLVKVNAGVINWNAPTTGAASSSPFGGIGRSGNHRPSAFYAADYCSYPVASIESAELSLPEKMLPGLEIMEKTV